MLKDLPKVIHLVRGWGEAHVILSCNYVRLNQVKLPFLGVKMVVYEQFCVVQLNMLEGSILYTVLL